jgi:hypothetical protein
MTLPRLAALTAYWRNNPPLHQLVAAYIGYKPTEQRKGIVDFVEESGLVVVTGIKHG